MSVESQHTIENQPLQRPRESAILSIIEKKHQLEPNEKEKIKIISDKVEQSNKRSVENKNKFLSSFVDNYQVQSQAGTELALCMTMIEKNIIGSEEEQTYFQADPIQYINQLIGDIKSTDDFKKSQYINSEKKEISSEKKEVDIQISQNIQEKEKNIAIIAALYADSGNGIKESKNGNYLNTSIGIQEFNETKTNEGTGLADYLVTNLKLQPEQVTDFLRYQVYLHNKPEKTAAEQATADKFSSFLSSSGIDSESFFSSLGSKDVIARDEAIQESQDKAPTLATISDPKNIAQMKGVQETTNSLPSAFEGEQRKTEKLLKSFPLPKEIDKTSFVILDSNPESLSKLKSTYEDLTKQSSNIDYPLFDKNPNFPKGSDNNRNLRHLAFLNQLVNSNPNITPEQFTDTMKKLQTPIVKGMETPTQVRNIAQINLSSHISNKLKSIDADLRQQAVPRHMEMIQNILSGTPGLENFQINPKEIEIRPDGFMIPYRLPGHTDICGQIENNNGETTVTNALYDEGNTDSVTNIIFGKVGVGKMTTLQDYQKEITSKITPDDFLSALDSESPEGKIASETATESKRANEQINNDLSFTKTRLSHQLAGTQVAEAGFDLMRSFHLDDKATKPDEKTSPFREALQNYNFTADQGKNQTINPESSKELYNITTILRNSTLGASVEENNRMRQGLNKLNTITKDPQFMTNLKSKVPDSSTLSGDGKKALLACCHPDQKNNPAVLSNILALLSHQSDDPQHRKIDITKLEKLVTQLESIKSDPTQVDRFDLAVERSHTFEAVTDGVAKANADQELEKELEMV